MKYEVKVKLAASKGIAEIRTINVDAAGVTEAIVAASFKLDAQGQDRWSLESVTPVKEN